MSNDNKKSKIDLERSLKPSGAYLDSLSDFADLLGTIKQAEDAAKELLDETKPIPGAVKPPPSSNKQPADTSAGGSAPHAEGLQNETNSD